VHVKGHKKKKKKNNKVEHIHAHVGIIKVVFLNFKLKFLSYMLSTLKN